MPQPNRYQPLIHQLEYLEAAYHLHICVKDYVGFIPIDKELSARSRPIWGTATPIACLSSRARAAITTV